MRLLDSRRLTGASLFLDSPGAVIDISVSDDDRALLIAAWERHARRLVSDLGWSEREFTARAFEGGVSLALAAPVDGLYTATEVNETAWEAARDWIEGGQRNLLRRVSRSLRDEYHDEERPRLKRLLAAAREHGTAVILDDDVLTLGSGKTGMSWELFELPHPDDVPWKRLRAVPTLMVTGTNGKTTTVRLIASVARAAGLCAGVSSTDWLAMGDELLDRDDYAGPGGARLVLRDQRCELAILETARGGLLRRGLAVEHADAALITNIAADHLGEYGIHTVEDLTAVKWSVVQALDSRGPLVLNADDDQLMQRSVAYSGPLVLFATDPRNPLLRDHLEAGGTGFTLYRGKLTKVRHGVRQGFLSVKHMPLAYEGAALHNVSNGLAAAAIADAVGIDLAHIAAGLKALRNDDNPGRANVYRIGDATVLVDFAHNPAGLEALMPMAMKLPAKRRMLVTGQAGDRSDDDIREFAEAAGAGNFDRIVIKRMDGHARGRDEGEVAQVMREAFRGMGYPARSLTGSVTELDAARAALRWAKAGDLVVFLSHEKRDATQDFFREHAASEDAS